MTTDSKKVAPESGGQEASAGSPPGWTFPAGRAFPTGIRMARDMASRLGVRFLFLAVLAAGAWTVPFLRLVKEPACSPHTLEPTWLLAVPLILGVHLLLLVLADRTIGEGQPPRLRDAFADLAPRLPAALGTLALLFGLRFGAAFGVASTGAAVPTWLALLGWGAFGAASLFALHQAVLAGRGPAAAVAGSVRLFLGNPRVLGEALIGQLFLGCWFAMVCLLTFGAGWAFHRVDAAFYVIVPTLVTLLHVGPLLAGIAWTAVHHTLREGGAS